MARDTHDPRPPHNFFHRSFPGVFPASTPFVNVVGEDRSHLPLMNASIHLIESGHSHIGPTILYGSGQNSQSWVLRVLRPLQALRFRYVLQFDLSEQVPLTCASRRNRSDDATL